MLPRLVFFELQRNIKHRRKRNRDFTYIYIIYIIFNIVQYNTLKK